jgi:hypothetical protein
MTTERKMPIGIKILVCLLLLGSLAMLLPLRALPWMKLVVDDPASLDGRVSMEEFLSWFRQDRDQLPQTAARLLNQFGVAADPADPALQRLGAAAVDAYFPLPELARLTGSAGDLAESLGEAEAAGLLHRAELGVWGLLGLLALLGLIALISLLRDRPMGVLPYFLLSSLALTGLILLRRAGNDWLEQNCMESLRQLRLDMLPRLLSVDLRVIHMGIAAYLCPFLALLAMLFGLIRRRVPLREEPAPTPYPARRPPRPWTCPNCGSVRRDGGSYCTICGTGRTAPAAPAVSSAPPACPACGAALERGAAFCPYCGAPQG